MSEKKIFVEVFGEANLGFQPEEQSDGDPFDSELNQVQKKRKLPLPIPFFQALVHTWIQIVLTVQALSMNLFLILIIHRMSMLFIDFIH